ncbi:Zinc finger CCCH domain-containing protein ZFN-like [Sesamum angolense]|uniref:Zinc finger CCCH domain-containing protein ZFN-like n=1 Tax=Sesamum angolense TaxID=2727404 RepID=A0AAE1W2U6_9LAMI|nr:Zinc finger CCCH domain-containing protein ZFN-like [Sesamum angolense]
MKGTMELETYCILVEVDLHLQAITTARMKSEYPERIGQPECQAKFHILGKLVIAGDCLKMLWVYPLPARRYGQTFVPTRLFGHLVIHSPSCHSIYLSYDNMSCVDGFGGRVCRDGCDVLTTHRSINIGVLLCAKSACYNCEIHHAHIMAILARTYLHSAAVHHYYRYKEITDVKYRNLVFPRRAQVEASSPSSRIQATYMCQPECQFYMKTGDCKFGAVCKFHHPRERLIPLPDCVLSPIGLPLRPGEPLCVFYSRYGVCKFGPSCKFDHPMRVFAHNAAASASTDGTAVRDFMLHHQELLQ